MDVSIIITTYNYERYLESCIYSCVWQTACDVEYEIIIVDDGSSDDTPTILKKTFAPNVRCYRIENSGIEKASNYGFNRAKGKYIVRVDADDTLLPDYLLSMQPYLKAGHSFLYSDYQVIDQNGDEIREFRLPQFDQAEIFGRGDFLATGTLFRADLIKRLAGYKVDIVNSGLENYEFVLRLLQLGFVGVHVPQILFGYRRHLGNISELKRDQIIQNGKLLFETNEYGAFTSNHFHPYGLEIV